MASYYKSGSVSIANGATTVTGASVTFVAQAKQGDTFISQGISAIIASVSGNTQFDLLLPWEGTSLVNETDYAILHTSADWHSIATVNDQITTLISKIDSGVPFQPDASGTLANRAVYDTAIPDPSFFYLRTDVDPWVIYAKLSAASGDWSAGVSMRGTDGSDGNPGVDGTDGIDGWTPVFSVVTDGSRRVLQVSDWVGGTGTKPTTGQYASASGLTSTIASAVDVRGSAGADSTVAGPQGDKGWAPLLSVVSDGARRVLQVSDWTGGQGTKPATGDYVGPAGLTSTLASAIDIRGPTGADSTVAGPQGYAGWTPIVSVVTDGARRVLEVVDWAGGEGAKPTTGLYVGATGLTSVLASAVDVRGSAGADSTVAGPQGDKGWSPMFATVSDGARRVLQVSDWEGGAGTKPASGDYLGATGLTSTLASAIDIRGPIGLTGDPGDKGWAPVLSLISDGTRRVLQVSDWTGGAGTKPAVGDYVGPTGLTSTLADAIDLRGPAGAGTGDVLGPGAAVDGNIVFFDGTSGDSIKDSGVSLDTDGTLSANSDLKIPTQKAVRTRIAASEARATALAFFFS